jgi:hypothetical protein
VLNPHRDRLCPPDQRKVRRHRQQRKQDRADRIDVRGRVQRHPSERPRRRIAKLVRRPRVRRLVNREGNDEESELDEDADEIDAQQGKSAYHGILPTLAKDPPHAAGPTMASHVDRHFARDQLARLLIKQ